MRRPQVLLCIFSVFTAVYCLAPTVADFLKQPNAIAPEYRFLIDGESYLAAGTRAQQVGWREATDYRYSVGMQWISMGWVFLWGDSAPGAFRVLNALGWIAALGAMIRIVVRGGGLGGYGAPLAVFWVAGSALFSKYLLLYQPEFLLVGLASLLLLVAGGPVTRQRAAFVGGAVAALAAIRLSYLLWLPVWVLWVWSRSSSSERFPALGSLLGAFLLVSVPWNTVHSLQFGRPYFYTPLKMTSVRFRMYLNPGASPRNMPLRSAEGPEGLRFIVERPEQYWGLLRERSMYLLGLKGDGWYVPSRWGTALSKMGLRPRRARDLVIGVGLLGLIAGFLFLIRSPEPGIRWYGWAGAGLLVLGVIPHLLIGASTRFLVPLFPAYGAFQAVAVSRLCVLLGEAARRKGSLVRWALWIRQLPAK